MPNPNEIRSGEQLGYKKQRGKWIWSACIGCGEERWVRFVKGNPVNLKCRACASRDAPKQLGAENKSWKGGRFISNQGYAQIHLYPNDFFYPMAWVTGYVPEHRLVVAKALGRNLHSWEIVHHKHDRYPRGSIEDKQDNRYPENLQLVSDLGHKQLTRLEEKIDNQTELIDELRKEIRLLRWELKEKEVAPV